MNFKPIYLLSAFSLSFLLSYSQLSEGGKPKSFSAPQLKSAESLNSKALNKLNINRLIRQDEKEGIDNRYAVYKEVDINIKQQGNQQNTSDGKIYQYEIISQNAFSIGLYFKKYNLPEGAELFIYNSSKDIIYGAFTNKNNKSHHTFSIADFPGSGLIIEYFEPENTEFSGELILGKIGQSYRDITESKASLSNGENLNIDINCPEGDLVQLEKHSVARMSFNEGDFGYFCTGALINNVRKDGTPYFLTANHCISTNVVANSLITDFNYETNDCNGWVKTPLKISGAQLIATHSATDFTLLLLEETPTASYQPYYAGWNASSNQSVKSGSAIHHPEGGVKEIALSYSDIYSYPGVLSWEGGSESPSNTHWLVAFNKGVTKSGSSGSPLFDNNNRIIGQLHGAGIEDNYYGKVSRSWEIGTTNDAKLKPWLDPDNSNTKMLEGYSPANNLPDAHPYSIYQEVCAGEAVKLTNGSLFNSGTTDWTFFPTTVTYLEGTNSTSANPIVSFDEKTTYTISLRVTKDSKEDIQVRNNYISSGDNLGLSILPATSTKLCVDDFSTLKFYSAGADSFAWNVLTGNEYISIDELNSNSDSLIILSNGSITTDSTIAINIQLTGYHGQCTDTIVQKIELIFPFNDDIANAYHLELGKSGPYTNRCASLEFREPSPSATSCESQTEWCSCDVSQTVVENSVWFTLDGPETGIIAINAPGFDDQIALYEADTYTDVISGNSSRYKLIAANDDYFGESQNYSALIKGAVVTPGKKYWLQVDGSSCGAEGDFSLELYPYDIEELFPASVSDIKKDTEIIIYPNPASTEFTINNIALKGEIKVSLISLEGRTLQSYNPFTSIPGVENIFSIPESISNGYYILKIENSDNAIVIQIAVLR